MPYILVGEYNPLTPFDPVGAVGIGVMPGAAPSRPPASTFGASFVVTQAAVTPWASLPRTPWTPSAGYDPFIPPAATFATGPVGASVDIKNYRSNATATDTDAGVAFYISGLEPVAGCKAYWEYNITGSGGDDVGGFGVGSGWTDVDSKPGEGTNPGCMLYVESGQWRTCNNGACENVSGSGVPSYVGVGVEVIDETSVKIRWYPNGTDLGVEEIFEFSGPLWVPALYLSTTDYTFELVNS